MSYQPLDIGCNISDAELLRALSEDVPGMAESICERLRKLAAMLDVGPLLSGMEGVPCAVRKDGWLFIPHADGNWISAAQLSTFSQQIIEHWRIEKGQRRG